MAEPGELATAESLAVRVAEALRDRGATLATAESLTGGLLAAALTSVPGVSVVYRGGLVVYATDLKASLGGLEPNRLAAEGAVSAWTAGELARGAARRCGADWGLATTGVAGPDPQEGRPAGIVFVGWCGPKTGGTLDLKLAGTRREIREQTVRRALAHLFEAVGSSPGGAE